jgi:effector-binding domain-containing protein
MKKKLLRGFILLLIGALIWYLFLKPNDYQITFNTDLIPGVANQAIKLWADGLDNAKLLEQTNLTHFAHQIKHSDSIHRYEWDINPLTDSTSQVKVLITDVDHSLANKVAILFSETDFENRSIKTVRNLRDILKEHSERFKVTIIGEEDIPETYCAYLTYESKQKEKALKMMQGYPFMNTLANYGIKSNGLPFIEVKNWKIEKDSLAFNFCYPIIKTDSLPQIEGLRFKEIKRQKAIKAIYNGNYITSDRAWYSLMDYAKKNDLAVEKRPFEYFFNNPNMGGDELNWEAQVFLPLKN